MKLHFHKAKTPQEANELGSTIVYGLSDGVFRLLEWTLVIATLLYLGEKTGDGLFSTVAHLLLPLVYLRQMAFMDVLDIEFWPPPYQRWQLRINFLVHMVVGLVCAGGAYFLAVHMAKAVAAASPL